MTALADEPHVGLVVEGRGDQGSVPMLLRRYLQEIRTEYRDVLGAPVVCHGRDKATRIAGIEKFVATAGGRPGCVGVLVVLDAETDPACELGPELLERANAATSKPVLVCLAERDFEGWLLASAETLGLEGLTYSPTANAQARIREALDGKYIKPTWEPRLTARVDIQLAAGRSQSLLRTLGCLDNFVDLVILELESESESDLEDDQEPDDD